MSVSDDFLKAYGKGNEKVLSGSQLSQLVTVSFMSGLPPAVKLQSVHGEFQTLTATVFITEELLSDAYFAEVSERLVHSFSSALDYEALHSDKYFVKPMTDSCEGLTFERLEAPNERILNSPNYKIAIDGGQDYKLMLKGQYVGGRIHGFLSLPVVKTRIDFKDRNFRLINYKDSLLVNPDFSVSFDENSLTYRCVFSARLLLVGFLVPDGLGG